MAETRSSGTPARRAGKGQGGGWPGVLASSGAHAVMLLTIAICIFPLVVIVSTSLKPASDIFDLRIIPAHPTLSNYQYVLSGGFLTWLANSVKISLLTMAAGLALAAPAAYAVSRWQFIGKQGLLLLFLITQMFPGVLLVVPLYLLFAQINLLNSLSGLVIAYATTALPFSVWMLKNFFDAVPMELDEAALVDGLGPFQAFWRIVLPLTLPGLAVVAFFNFMAAWNEFLLAYTFLQSESQFTLAVGIQRYVNQFGADWQYLTASAVLITLPVLILFLWLQRYLVTGLTGGSVKA